jgi:hypothetical protein
LAARSADKGVGSNDLLYGTESFDGVGQFSAAPWIRTRFTFRLTFSFTVPRLLFVLLVRGYSTEARFERSPVLW